MMQYNHPKSQSEARDAHQADVSNPSMRVNAGCTRFVEVSILDV
jgi:hypothetical protein